MIDFTGVKNIAIPEGEVSVIARGDKILWQKQKYKRELQYLESTGTQWIDIGTTVDTSTDVIELYFQLTETANYKWFFGEYDDNARLGLGSGDGANKRNFLYKSAATKVSDADFYDKKHLYSINTSGAFIDGVKKVNYVSFASTSSLYLFNININSASDYRCKAKVWSYKQTRNGIVIRDLIPVLDLNDIPCMYDKVSGNLFYNKGTGVFEYEELPELPLEYQRVAYLRSTGTQWIDTEVVVSHTPPSIKIKFHSTDYKNNYIGVHNNGSRLLGIRKSDASTVSVTDYNRATTTIGVPQENEWNEVFVDKSTKTIVADGNSVPLDMEFRWYDANTTNLSLFGVRRYNTNNAYCAIVDIAYCELYNNNMEMIRNFIPCYRKSDGEAGMYDLVDGKFYTNQGIGEFLYG